MKMATLLQIAEGRDIDADILPLIPTDLILSEIERRKVALSLEIAALNGKVDQKQPIPEDFPLIVSALIKRAADLFQVPQKSILGDGRKESVARARFAIWHVLRNHGHSFASIGLAFNRTHGAVMNGCQRAEKLSDTIFLHAVEDLTFRTPASSH